MVTWVSIPMKCYRKKYEVSNDGRVRRKESKTEVGMGSIRCGYRSVCLNDNGHRKMHKVHRLVARAFVENDDPENKTVVNHKDGDKLNNNAKNLEWVTVRENNQHSQDTGLTPKTCRAIYQCDLNGNIIKKHDTLRGAARDTGVSTGSICHVCKGRYKTAGGFKWRFVDVNPNEGEIDLSDFVKVKDFPNYMINKKGTVYSLRYKKIMKTQTNAEKTLTITLSKDNKSCSFLVHRLIAMHFIPNDDPVNKIKVIHINGRKKDNRIENLKWS